MIGIAIAGGRGEIKEDSDIEHFYYAIGNHVIINSGNTSTIKTALIGRAHDVICSNCLRTLTTKYVKVVNKAFLKQQEFL